MQVKSLLEEKNKELKARLNFGFNFFQFTESLFGFAQCVASCNPNGVVGITGQNASERQAIPLERLSLPLS